MINKKNLQEVLQKNAPIFKQELGSGFTPEIFLEQIEKGEVSLAQAIHNSQRLLGIMLGYGKRNATLFQQRFDARRYEEKKRPAERRVNCEIAGN